MLAKIFCICILYWQYKNLIDPSQFIVKIDSEWHIRASGKHFCMMQNTDEMRKDDSRLIKHQR